MDSKKKGGMDKDISGGGGGGGGGSAVEETPLEAVSRMVAKLMSKPESSCDANIATTRWQLKKDASRMLDVRAVLEGRLEAFK